MGKPTKIQAIAVADVVLKVDDKPKVVDTSKITPQQREWDGKLILIRDLRGGKSQVSRLAQ